MPVSVIAQAGRSVIARSGDRSSERRDGRVLEEPHLASMLPERESEVKPAITLVFGNSSFEGDRFIG
jgi:hypothetical protein